MLVFSEIKKLYNLKRSNLVLFAFIFLLNTEILSKKNTLEFLEDKINYDSNNGIDVKNSFSLYLNEDNNNSYFIKSNTFDENALAYCNYDESLMQKGWDFLAISSYQGLDQKYTDEQKAYGMGYLEGYITAEKIWSNYLNQKKYTYGKNKNSADGEMPENVKEFLSKNFQFIRIEGLKNFESDPYWQHAYLIFIQLEGMLDGYNKKVKENSKTDNQIKTENKLQKLSLMDLQVINAAGDIGNIEYYNSKLSRPDFSKMTHEQISMHFEEKNHCSSLIKVAADLSDVWFGHNTWTNYSSMLRIFKEYRFSTNNKTEKSKTVAFSSYPGSLSSIDDFYITDRDLYVTETTNQIFKTELFDLLNPKTLLTWHRAMIANRLSDSGKKWTDLFSKYNSGTYNNQFQILDLNKIDTQKREIQSNAFWIIEQIPGQTEAADMTNILRYGYWPSYNSAYFPNIRKLSGYDEQLEIHPELKDSIDYSSCARANIFRRDQNKINDIEAYRNLLRYNDYENDNLSKQNPGLAIACRRDLDKQKPDCRGATDAKVASINDIKGKQKKKILMISGPTNDQQPAFDWGNAKCLETGKYVINGLPQKYEFPWVEYETKFMN